MILDLILEFLEELREIKRILESLPDGAACGPCRTSPDHLPPLDAPAPSPRSNVFLDTQKTILQLNTHSFSHKINARINYFPYDRLPSPTSVERHLLDEFIMLIGWKGPHLDLLANR